MSRYILEISRPDSMETAWTLESKEPFLAIAKGDLINNRLFGGNEIDGILKVQELEHIIWEGPDGMCHKICVFTTEVPDDEGTRSRHRKA